MSNLYPPTQVPPTKRRTARAWLIAALVGLAAIVLGLLCAGVLGSLGSSSSNALVAPTSAGAATGAKAPKAIAKPAPPILFSAGDYETGKISNPAEGTIAPGTYRVSTNEHCYWERVRSFDGEFDSIISNGNVDDGQIVRVVVKKTDAGLSLRGDCSAKPKG